MHKLISTPVYSIHSTGTFSQFSSSAMPSLERRINFEFKSLNAGDVINKLVFDGQNQNPMSALPDKSTIEFVGAKPLLWNHPLMDGLFFVVKNRAGDITPIMNDSHPDYCKLFPFTFLVLFVNSGSSYIASPKPDKTSSPVGKLKDFNIINNVNDQRLAMQDIGTLSSAQRGALIAANNKRYIKDVSLDLVTSHAASHNVEYSQKDVSRITDISARLLRSTYNDKWQSIKTANNAADMDIAYGQHSVKLP